MITEAEMTFDDRIRKAISDTKTECNYNPKAFIQMVNTYGALETAKRLLASKQNIASGLEKLWELGRLDLCFERIIFEPEWHDLFTKEELTEAKKRLKVLNYDVSELSVEPLNNRHVNKSENFILNLSKESFIEALRNITINDYEIQLMNCFISSSTFTLSATQIAEKLEYSDIGAVNLLLGKFAKKIADFYQSSLEREGNSPRWWRIISNGQEVDNLFYWTLKSEFMEALKELEIIDLPTYWLLPCNENNYDVEKAYLKYHTVDWKQTNKQIAVNDIVYIYKTKPDQVVRFTCRVKAINKKKSNKKDLDCYQDSTPYENKDCYMTLEFINRFEESFPTMENLEKNGVPVIRSLIKVPDTALNYIKEVESSDNTAKRFDGVIPYDIPHNHWSLVGGDEEELKEKANAEAKALSDNDLFQKAKQLGSISPIERITTTSTYVRNPYIAEASKRKANGICQLCEKPAPFNDKNGNPYLESHHIIWLSEGGADELSNTVALCPNCHKKMHIVNDDEDVKKLLMLN